MANLEQKLKVVIRGIAPVLGAAIGGPLGTAALGVLSEVFFGNKEATPEKIFSAINDNLKNASSKLKEAEINFELQSKALHLDFLKLDFENISDARNMNVEVNKSDQASWLAKNITHLLAVFYTVGYFSIVWHVLFMGTGSNSTIADMILGSITSIQTLIFGFYYGTTLSSRFKDWTINNFSKK